MFTRKKYLINKKFQIKTTFTIIGVTVLIFTLLLVVIGINLIDSSKKMDNILTIEKDIVDALSVPDPRLPEDEQKITSDMARHHDQNLKAMREIITTNQALMLTLTAAIFIQGVIVFFVLLIQTHRIAGPIYVISVYMKQIINGSIPNKLRPLRGKDHLKDFYRLFTDLVESIRECREGKQVTGSTAAKSKSLDTKTTKAVKKTKAVAKKSVKKTAKKSTQKTTKKKTTAKKK